MPKRTQHRRRAKKVIIEEEKEQGAMEYLITYGWALLIMAVILAVLLQLGVFASSPRALPGSCNIYRPNGPFTTAYITTEGVGCSGLLPEFVAYFNGFDSQAGTTAAYSQYISNAFTISLWFYAQGSPGNPTSLISGGNGQGAINVGYNPSFQLNFSPGCTKNIQAQTIAPDKWYNVVFTVQGTSPFTDYSFYLNGVQVSNGVVTCNVHALSNLVFGHGGGPSGNPYTGYMANVQFYNISLPRPEAQHIYTSGIGAAPYDLNPLLAWWPMNGNLNDYSGNSGGTIPTNIVFYSSGWPTP